MKKPTQLLLILCLAGPVMAQAAKVQFRTLGVQVEPGLETFTMPGEKAGEVKEVKLFTDISPEVEGVFPSGQAEFFVETAGTDGKPTRRTVAKAPLAKSTRQLFVFIPTGNKEKLPYHLVCYADDTEMFPMGHIRAINLAPGPVRFVISGGTTPEVPSGKYAQFPHSTKVDGFDMYPVVVEFRGADGKWVKGQSVNWKATDRRREVVITMIEPKFKQPAVRLYSDVPPWLEAPVAAP